jgi:hypothetical protein
MNGIKIFALTAATGLCLATLTPQSQAQVSITIGAAPACPYGYYDYSPYNCAPYGYYGPEWFTGGVFVGAGPWYHGHSDFHGQVDNHYDVQKGYHGPVPARGEKPAAEHPVPPKEFHGNETHAVHPAPEAHEGGNEGHH